MAGPDSATAARRCVNAANDWLLESSSPVRVEHAGSLLHDLIRA